ncbi:Fe-S protein assembly co-chaperone HscB [Thiofilum flexile]|uniref:Fe-S protein assembly co-chaperone HscB n=1 Tax=Thiofilum flexile TaxID=125627 RepID=UPI00037F4CD4|nr:Fe-S protein assembly co-chaperone HscB [Thiofilum flexile]
MQSITLPTQWFELFGLPLQFEVDPVVLTQRFRALQTQFHPDRYVNQSDTEKRFAVQATSLINEAYAGLKNPRLRARYLLEQAGIILNDELDTIQDRDFLIQQMQWREAIEEALEDAEPLDALDQVGDEIQAVTLTLYSEFAQVWALKNLERAKQIVLKLRFYERLQEEIRRQQERLDA